MESIVVLLHGRACTEPAEVRWISATQEREDGGGVLFMKDLRPPITRRNDVILVLRQRF